MSFLEKNLEVLSEYREDLAQKVREFAKLHPEGSFIVEPAKSGMPTAKWLHDGKVLYCHSSYDPVREAGNWVEGIKEEVKKTKSVIIVGFGLGYHLEEYLKHVPEETRTLVFEPKLENFYNALCTRDLTHLFKAHIHYSVEATNKTIVREIAGLTYYDLTESPFLKIFPSYDRVFPDYCSFIEKELRENIGGKILNINTILFFADLWPTNFFGNLMNVLNNPGIKNLFDKFKGKPAIIVSAGPSLTKNVELLKEVKEKAFIICVDTALRVLFNLGIMPDVVVLVDGSELNFKHFEGIDPTPVPLIFNCEANVDMIRLHKGRKFPLNMRVALMDWLEKTIDEEYGKIDQSGPSVANIALQVAKKAGADPIILIGQDLAYTGGNSHASGTALCKNDVIKQKNPLDLLKVKDVFGNEVYTDRGFYAMLKSFEGAIEHIEAKVIDATEGGARIEGTEIMTLREVIDKYCTNAIDVSGVIDGIFDSYPGFPQEKREKLTAAFKDVEKSLKKIKRFAGKGVKLAGELRRFAGKNRLDDPKVNKLIKKMDELDKGIKEEEESIVFVQMIIQPVMLQVIRGPLANAPDNESEKDRGIRVALKSQLLYQGIMDVSEYMLGLVEKAIDELRSEIIGCG